MNLFVVLLGLAQPCCFFEIRVKDSNGAPLADARVTAVSPETELAGKTDASGALRLHVPSARTYRLAAGKDGYEPLSREVQAGAVPVAVEFLLPPVVKQSTSVTVTGEAESTASSAAGGTVTGEQLKWSGADPSRLRDALPLIPGIYRSPEGRLRLSGGDEHRASLLINSVDVTDPATGRFGATVPIDSVATLNVYRNPFLAEYGRFSTSVVSVESRRGGDKWHWELNDPTPEFRIRSGHIVGIRGFTPRLSFLGPLIKNKLYFSQSLEYALRKIPTFTLQFPNNEEKQESWNGLTQFDAIPSASHWLTVSLHGVPQRSNHVRPSFYNPLPATPSWRGHEYRGSVTDKWSIGGSLLESTLAYGETRGLVGAQGDLTLVMTPTVNDGNYFARNDRVAARAQWLETYTMAPREAKGAHHVKMGSSLVRTRAHGEYRFRDIDINGMDAVRFLNQGPYSLSDWELGLFAQDHWVMSPSVSLDYGLRTDWQKITGTTRVAPRAGLSWSLFGDPQTVLRTGFGWFYDRVPLSVYSFVRSPIRNGVPNVLGEVKDGLALVFGASRPGNFTPQTTTWSTSIEHRFSRLFHVRGGYQENRSRGLVVMQPEAEANVLRGAGQTTYRQLELLTRVRYMEGQELMFSYIRAFNHGNLNDFAQYLGDFPEPILRPDFRAEIPGNIPHRFLAWGEIPLIKNWRIAPVVEYRTGFPWSALNELQQYAEPPNSQRYPHFLSVDFKVSRDFSYKGRKFRVSFAMFNSTNHWNPDTVRWNRADPQFGEFLGNHRRRYRLDFDILN